VKVASGSWRDEFAFSFQMRGITSWAPHRWFDPHSRADCSNQRVDPLGRPLHPTGTSRRFSDKAFTNTLESRALATLRDTLLPKLLSGELSAATAATAL
jgi:hypothetical protein